MAIKQGELKFFDTTKSATTVDSAGTILDESLVIIPEGVGEEERVGRKIHVKSWYLKGNILLPASTSEFNTSDIIRLMIVWNKQTNKTGLTILDLLKTADLFSHRNVSAQHKFVILYDRYHTMNASAGGGNGTAIETCESRRMIKIYKKCNISISYSATAATGAVSTQETNNILVFAITAGAHIQIAYTVRIRYTD